MNTIPTNYVTHETFLKEVQNIHNHIDYLLKQIFDYIRVENEGTEKKLEKKIEASEQKLQKQINQIDEKLDNNLIELKDINKSYLRLLSYQESRLFELEKQSHTHPADML